MKKIFSLLFLMLSTGAYAYPYWDNFTPTKVIVKSGISLQNKVIIYAEGSVNSCAGLFEGNKYKVKFLSCENGVLSLEMKNKNKVECEAAMEVVKKFSIILPNDCSISQGSQIIINGQKIQ
ncbi:MAG: hypothetical protein V4598_11270 [Bdellovibrionota bacterium]